MECVVHRSLQIAHSDPKGPVYLVGAREVMEAETKSVQTADESLFPLWTNKWKDLMDFEIIPVRTSAEVVQMMSAK